MNNTALDLDAIEARCEALDERLSRKAWTLEGPDHYGLFSVYDSDGNVICYGVKEQQDFIVHARSDVPALVAEVERLQTESDIWDKYSLVQIVTDCTELRAEVKQLRCDLHDERVRRDEWHKMYDQAVTGTEVERLRERVEHWKRISLKVAQVERSKQLAEIEQLLKTALDNEVDSRVHTELEVERLQAELALTRVTLNRVRQDAQDQSDEVQELWLSPCEAEGLRRQLARAQIQAAAPKKATEWLWGFWDGNTLVAKPGYEDDIREAWDKLLMAVDSIAGDALLERLTEAEQRAERAEALAALVNEETAGLLERLSKCYQPNLNIPGPPALRPCTENHKAAHALAARIREALEETGD